MSGPPLIRESYPASVADTLPAPWGHAVPASRAARPPSLRRR